MRSRGTQSDHEHRARRRLDNGRSCTAKRQPRQATAPVRADYDQFRVDQFRVLHNHVLCKAHHHRSVSGQIDSTKRLFQSLLC